MCKIIRTLYKSKNGTRKSDKPYLYIGNVRVKNGVCETTVCSGEDMVELYLNGELRFRQKGSREFVFCTRVNEMPEGDLEIKASSFGDRTPLTDRVTVRI